MRVIPADARLPVITGAHTLSVPITWYPPPADTQSAVVWLQHGFARSRRRMAPLATFLAGQGWTVLTTTLRTVDPFARTVQNLGGNTRFLAALADALAHDLPTAWSRAGITGTPPSRLLAAGHSAGGDAAAFVAGYLADSGNTDLAGLLLLDPVRSARGTNLVDGLRRMRRHELPTRIVAAAPSRCNNRGSGVRAALTQLSGFAGVRLTDGSHLDAEGRDADRIAGYVCGAPQPSNVAALEELSTLWLDQMLHDPPADPMADATVERLTRDGRAQTLWGQIGSTSNTR